MWWAVCPNGWVPVRWKDMERRKLMMIQDFPCMRWFWILCSGVKRLRSSMSSSKFFFPNCFWFWSNSIQVDSPYILHVFVVGWALAAHKDVSQTGFYLNDSIDMYSEVICCSHFVQLWQSETCHSLPVLFPAALLLQATASYRSSPRKCKDIRAWGFLTGKRLNMDTRPTFVLIHQ